MKKICILDYGMGNIRSLKNALNKIGYEVNFYSEKQKIESSFLIIPGVGAFNSAIKILKKKKIDENIYEFLKNKNNFLFGICLGKQLLYSSSEENIKSKGLNLVKGNVTKITNNKKLKLPNVGWNEIIINKKNLKILEYIKTFDKKKFYFVHSFRGIPVSRENIIATSVFNNINFCSIVNNNNILGVQFHPEKSANNGLDFLQLVIKNHIQ